jgi:insulysin
MEVNKIITLTDSNKLKKSINDKRDYKMIELENKLKVLIISDPKASNSAASLSVGIGSLDEGKIHGLAHFLEHMLFMGSKKYPDENDYGETISKYGGYSNAYTADDHTCYYFSVPPSGFNKVLDIFAQFFIEPLFNESSVKREMNAVDSEHKKNLTNDVWKISQVLKCISKKDHPHNNFGTGCLETLNLDNIVKLVKDFYEKYYTSENMCLVLLDIKPIEKIEQTVIKIFSDIPNKKININRKYGLPFETPKLIKIIPVKSYNEITIIWQIPNADKYLDKLDNYKPLSFISHVIGHEGHGSIYELLRKNNLAETLYSGMEEKIGDVCLFETNIRLTNLGYENIKLVIDIIYEYIDILKKDLLNNSSKITNIYNDNIKLNNIGIKNLQKQDPSDYVTHLSSKWINYKNNIEDLLLSEMLLETYSKNVNYSILEVLDYFNKKNSVIIITSKNYENKLDKKEKWYDTSYSVEDKINLNNNNNIKLDIKKNLFLPDKNKYITDNDKMITDIKSMKYPILLNNYKDFELWYQFNNVYNIPETIFMGKIFFPIVKKNKDNILLYTTFLLYINCVRDIINPDIYECNMSNYKTNFSFSSNTLTIYINGPSSKINKVLNMFIENILHSNITETVFHKIKTIIQKNLKNSLLEPPYKCVMSKLLGYIDYSYYTHKDILNVIDNIKYNDVINILDKYFVDISAKNYIAGNIRKEDSIKLANTFKKLLNGNKNNELKLIKTIKNLKKGKVKHKRFQSENPKERNSSIIICYNLGYVKPNKTKKWDYILCYLELIHNILNEKYYDSLRTKEQLGYIVNSSIKKLGMPNCNILTLAFIVQSNIQKSDYLITRTDKFINDSRKILEDIDINDVNNRIDSIIEQLSRPEDNLNSVVFKYYSRIISMPDVLNIEDILIKTYNKIKKNRKMKKIILKFYDKYFYNKKKSSKWIASIN